MKIHARSTPETRKRLSINVRLLLATIVGVLVVSAATWGLHAWQLKRVAAGLLARVEEAKENSDWVTATKSLQRYLLMWPADAERKVELAEVYDNVAKSPVESERLVTMQSLALGACETDPSLKMRATPIRRRMVVRLMELGRQEDALDQIVRIAESSEDIELKRLFALCRYQLAMEKRTHRPSQGTQVQLKPWLQTLDAKSVPDLLDSALLDNPGDIDLSMALANLCLGDPEMLRNSEYADDNTADLRARAMTFVDRMMAANRDNVYAWLSRYSVTSKIDRVAAESDIRQALAMAPDDSQVLTQAGLHYLDRAHTSAGVADDAQKRLWLESAAKYFQRVREISDDRRAELFLGLGRVLLEQEKLDSALSVWRDGVRVCEPPTIDLHFQIANTLIEAGRMPEALEALQEMDEAVRREGPILPRILQGAASRIAKQQWSNYYMTIGDYKSATWVLEQVTSGNQEMDTTNQAEVLGVLGSAYFRMEQWDRAADAYEKAVVLAPKAPQYHRGAAASWARGKRFGEALKHLQLIDYKSGSDWVQIAETVLEIQRRTRPDPGLWIMFDNAIVDAKRLQTSDSFLVSKPWYIELLVAEGLAVRATDADRSAKIAVGAESVYGLCEQYPESDELWRKAILRLREWDRLELAGDLLERLGNRAIESTEAAMAQAEVLVEEGLASDARRVLERRLESDPDNEGLKRTLFNLIGTMGDWDNLSSDKYRASSRDLVVLKQLCNLALKTPILEKESDLEKQSVVLESMKKWSSNVERLEKELRKVEGEEGTEWRYVRARRLLKLSLKGREGVEPILNEIGDLANYLDSKRPLWSATYLLQGNLAERQQSIPRAIQSYTRAIQLGEQEIEVFENLASLLYQQGMLTEAASLIERLGIRASSSRRLLSLALNLKEGDKPEMLEIARNGTLAQPTDHMAWVYYALTLEVSSRGFVDEERQASLAESRLAFERANELSEGGDVRVIGAEFSFLNSIGDGQAVQDLIVRVTNSTALDPVVKWVAVASIKQNLGMLEDALTCYDEALKAGGDRKEIGRRIGQLYLSQGKQDLAIEQYKKILQDSPEDTEVKRALATLLASRGTEEDWKQVGELISSSRSGTTPDDRRLEAELMVQRGTPSSLATAQYLLEGLVGDPNVRTDEDRFRLASVYLVNANMLSIQDKDLTQSKQLIEQARQQLKLACTGTETPPTYIYTYGAFLLQQDRYREAVEQSDRLALADPDGFETAFLKAQLANADGRPEAARATMVSWLDSRTTVSVAAKDSSVRSKLMVQAGQALMTLGFSEEAEQLLRDAFELDASTGLDYVRGLARTDSVVARQRAIEYLVMRVKQDRSSGTAKLLANLMSSGKVDPALQKAGEEALLEVGADGEADTQLLFAVADMWLVQNNVEKAIATYEKIIVKDPTDIVALNNLANLLAEQPNGSTAAMGLVDRAIGIAGRLPVLLDTKGIILLSENRIDEAIPIFEIAVAASPDPRLKLHLFVALVRAGRTEEAGRIRGKINLEDLRSSLLTPTDRAEVERLEGMSL